MSASDYRKQLDGCKTETELRRVLAVWSAVVCEPEEYPVLRADVVAAVERIEGQVKEAA